MKGKVTVTVTSGVNNGGNATHDDYHDGTIYSIIIITATKLLQKNVVCHRFICNEVNNNNTSKNNLTNAKIIIIASILSTRLLSSKPLCYRHFILLPS